jgi:hypothetical protein
VVLQFTTRLLLGFAASILISQPSEAGPPRSAQAETARRILSEQCFQCHGANGAAPRNIFVLNHARLLSANIVIPGDADSPLLRAIETGAMPLGRPLLSKEDQIALREWILAGAPPWAEPVETAPLSLSEAALADMIIADLQKAPPADRSHLRYFSLAHVAAAGTSRETLDVYRAALAKLVNSLSWARKITKPLPIDASQLVFRIDLRDYQWSAETWQRILEEYPYGISIPDAENVKELSGELLPYIRADWFVAAASTPPLYDDILHLPDTTRELEFLAGVDTTRDLAQEKNVMRGGVRTSGVSRNNRVLERHGTPAGAYWQSFDFRGNAGDQNIFQDPVRLRPAGGEIIFNLPNGLQAYFLANGDGDRIDAAPIEIVSDRHQADPVIRNGRSCMTCHYEGMRLFQDEVRPVLWEIERPQFNRNKALALFPRQDVLDRALNEDGKRFQKALAETVGVAAESPETEPVGALSRRFEADLDLAQAAAETGLSPGQFHLRLRNSARLIRMGLGSLLAEGGGVKRDTWEDQFSDIARELEIGEVISGRSIEPRMTTRDVVRKAVISIMQRGRDWKPEKSKSLSTEQREKAAAAIKVLEGLRTPPWNPPGPLKRDDDN